MACLPLCHIYPWLCLPCLPCGTQYQSCLPARVMLSSSKHNMQTPVHLTTCCAGWPGACGRLAPVALLLLLAPALLALLSYNAAYKLPRQLATLGPAVPRSLLQAVGQPGRAELPGEQLVTLEESDHTVSNGFPKTLHNFTHGNFRSWMHCMSQHGVMPGAGTGQMAWTTLNASSLKAAGWAGGRCAPVRG